MFYFKKAFGPSCRAKFLNCLFREHVVQSILSIKKLYIFVTLIQRHLYQKVCSETSGGGRKTRPPAGNERVRLNNTSRQSELGPLITLANIFNRLPWCTHCGGYLERYYYGEEKRVETRGSR